MRNIIMNDSMLSRLSSLSSDSDNRCSTVSIHYEKYRKRKRN